MDCGSFFYDVRLYAMATMELNDVCNKLGSPIIMLPSEHVIDNINFHSIHNKYEIKFFYRAYYIGSVFMDTIYNHQYIINNFNNICYQLKNNKLPNIYTNTIGKLFIQDESRDDDNDIDLGTSESDDDNGISEDIMRLFESINKAKENKKQEKEDKEAESDNNKDKESPSLIFKCDSYSEKARIWDSLPADFRMDLIKNCIVIDALHKYFKN